jgi:hypothetical protein
LNLKKHAKNTHSHVIMSGRAGGILRVLGNLNPEGEILSVKGVDLSFLPFLEGEKPFGKGEKPFGKGEKPFGMGEKPFGKGEKPFGTGEKRAPRGC